ncbi:ABC transporter ATP-binding protein [Rhizobium sp. 60-20]|uniref:ABC transporter ATP-binding protein n=1 Tax=Rhizobium sp. 60-20 TaxID=1895819 RepID=UPI00092926FD|nr:ABC transporter ATP-binding protein [Rhizobium sp. 60-20]OJY78700.1 MAG: ABC transporter ATP-binding protein [Rhizobium sp. 60-20]
MIGRKLILSGLQKRYADVWAVKETSLEIEPGEFVSIVGPSGSGKTSLLTMVAGFEMPTAGVIRIGDKDVTHLPPNRRDIGMVFQKYALFPHLTVGQNIAFPLKMRRALSGAPLKRRVEEILQLVQLSEYRDRYPGQLSGGQQQRVAVARALVFDPPIILMDEPLGALDKKLREAMQFELKRLQQRLGATVVYVTHDQDEALAMSDRVAVMKRGALQQIGPPVELYSKPANAFVADFIGVTNFLPGIHMGIEGNQDVIQLAEGILVRVPFNSAREMSAPVKGSPLHLAIRPEYVRLALSGEDVDGALAGIVETSVFFGPTQILFVRLSRLHDTILRVQMPASQAACFERGTNVDVLIDEARLQIFPAKEAFAA